MCGLSKPLAYTVRSLKMPPCIYGAVSQSAPCMYGLSTSHLHLHPDFLSLLVQHRPSHPPLFPDSDLPIPAPVLINLVILALLVLLVTLVILATLVTLLL